MQIGNARAIARECRQGKQEKQKTFTEKPTRVRMNARLLMRQ
jgi:hypothetical protein